MRQAVEHTPQPSTAISPRLSSNGHRHSAALKILIKWRCITHSLAKPLALQQHFQMESGDWFMTVVHRGTLCFRKVRSQRSDPGALCVCMYFIDAIIASCCIVLQGFFFPHRPVQKCLFLRCCLAFPGRPIVMRSLVAAVCKNRKQSRQRGVKQIHTTPNSVFSPFI